jgi:hypothetical protein
MARAPVPHFSRMPRLRDRVKFLRMPTDRSQMTIRIVPLGSDEASDGRVGGTAVERLALVRELSERMWALTRRPLPTYSRSTIPVKLTTLADQ